KAQNGRTSLGLVSFFRAGFSLEGGLHHAVPGLRIRLCTMIPTDDQPVFRPRHAHIEQPPVFVFRLALYLVLKAAHRTVRKILSLAPQKAGDLAAFEAEGKEVGNMAVADGSASGIDQEHHWRLQPL